MCVKTKSRERVIDIFNIQNIKDSIYPIAYYRQLSTERKFNNYQMKSSLIALKVRRPGLPKLVETADGGCLGRKLVVLALGTGGCWCCCCCCGGEAT